MCCRFASFRIIRGSIPVFWRQSNGIAKPEPELDGSIFSSRVAFTSHFKRLAEHYGSVVAVSLVNLHGEQMKKVENSSLSLSLYICLYLHLCHSRTVYVPSAVDSFATSRLLPSTAKTPEQIFHCFFDDFDLFLYRFSFRFVDSLHVFLLIVSKVRNGHSRKLLWIT